MNPNQPQEAPQKLVDFNTELKALCDKYQYELRAVLQFDPIRGIFGVLQAFDVSPKVDEGVPLTPSPEVPDTTPVDTAPTVETPAAQPEAPVAPAQPLPNEEPAVEATNQPSDPASLETSPSAENPTVDNSNQ